jgi:hypothetical protein
MVTPEQEALDTLSHALGTREQAAGVSEADIEIAFTTLYTYLDKQNGEHHAHAHHPTAHA